MNPCPDHVRDVVVSSEGGWSSDYFQVRCKECGGFRLGLLVSNLRTVKARCDVCGFLAIVYDLAEYPAATKLGRDEFFAPVEGCGELTGEIYVRYEYGDFDDEDHFDNNDITWCDFFMSIDGELRNVFSDETA